MNLNELKQSWQLAGAEKGVNQKELEQMTKISQHPVLGRIRLKLIIEAVAMAIFLFFFYDIFDGHTKPAYASVVLVMGAMFYLGSNIYSFVVLRQSVSADNVLNSLQHFLRLLQRAKAFSLTSLVLFSVSLWVYFTPSVSMDTRMLLLLAAMAGITAVFLYISTRTWSQWIGRIRQSIDKLAK